MPATAIAPLRPTPATSHNPHPPAAGRGEPRTFSRSRGTANPARGEGGSRFDRNKGDRKKPEHEILFQKFFKSVGPRTYAAQVKRASNQNHYLILTEGQRDEKTGDLRKSRVFIYSEDFVEFFRLVKSVAEFIKDHPVPPEVRQKQERYWASRSAAPTKP